MRDLPLVVALSAGETVRADAAAWGPPGASGPPATRGPHRPQRKCQTRGTMITRNPGQNSRREVDLELALTPPTDGSNIKATVVRLTPAGGPQHPQPEELPEASQDCPGRRPVNGVMVHRCIGA